MMDAVEGVALDQSEGATRRRVLRALLGLATTSGTLLGVSACGGENDEGDDEENDDDEEEDD